VEPLEVVEARRRKYVARLRPGRIRTSPSSCGPPNVFISEEGDAD